MLESFRARVGLWYAQLRFGRRRDPIMRFTAALSRAQRALVCLPESSTESNGVEEVFEYLNRKFYPENVLIIVPKRFRSSLPNHLEFKVLTYGEEDVNRWFIPRPELLQIVKKSTFDVALDLNRQFALTSAYLCRESQAPLRVSFTKMHADHFYNFQVKTGEHSAQRVAYRSLFNCLQMF